MNYCVSLKIQLDGDQWMSVGKDHLIPWPVRNLVFASSGWTMLNDKSAGAADVMTSYLQKGILELSSHKDAYIHYEVEHGIGTIRDVLAFYEDLLKDCKEHPYTKVYGRVVS